MFFNCWFARFFYCCSGKYAPKVALWAMPVNRNPPAPFLTLLVPGLYGLKTWRSANIKTPQSHHEIIGFSGCV
jgi:hypothetical protein